MQETIKLIGEYGITIVIAGIFLWTVIIDKKDVKIRDDKYNDSISLLSKAIDNMANLIDLLRQSNDNQLGILKQHDERSIKIKEEIGEVRVLVNNCPRKK